MNTTLSPTDVLLRQAIECTQREDFAGAASRLRALLDIDSRHVLAQGMLGGIHAQRGETALAGECFRRVLALDPGNPLARYQLGLLQLSMHETENALETWRPCLADDGDFVAHFHSAAVLMQLGRAGQARPLLETAAGRMPPDHALYPALRELMQTY